MNFPKIELSKGQDSSELLILSWLQAKSEKKGKTKPSAPAPPIFKGKANRELGKLVAQVKKAKNFRGGKRETLSLHYFGLNGHSSVLLVGLGPEEKLSKENARQAGAAVYFGQKRGAYSTATLDGQSFFASVGKKEGADYLQAFCEGYWLAGYKYDDLKKANGGPPEPTGLKVSGCSGAEYEKAIKRAKILAGTVCFARALGDRPSNFLSPHQLATTISKMAREKKMKCTVFNKARIHKEKMGLLYGVGHGSFEEPRFIILEHRGGKRNEAPIALVGKGVTFDTGGISLKPSGNMEEMKYDMMGSATVAGIMSAAADLKIKQNIMAFIPAAENMPGGRATKPGDVHRSISGKSVEITNTDAEGRLILADALEYAQKYKPQAIIDFATLTGAVVVALGSVATGIMGNNQKLLDRIKKAAEYSGERVWELPLYEDYMEQMKSSVADIKNASENREAGSSKGGIFLKFFIEDDVPWVHCDIAGSGMQRRDLNYAPRKYVAGVMIRLMTHMLENWEPLRA